MRRWIAVLASAALVVSLLTVPSAAVPVVSKVELTAARIVANGVGVDLTFNIRCKDFHNRVYITGELKQGVRKKRIATGQIGISDDDGSAIGCRKSMTTRVFAEDWAFRRGAVAATATVASCGPHDDDGGCREAEIKATVQVTRAQQIAPEPTTLAPGVLGVKLVSTQLAASGRAIDFRFKVTAKEIDRNASATFVHGIYLSQVSGGRVIRANVGAQYTEALPRPHVFTLRLSRPQGVRKFKARYALVSISTENYSEHYGEAECCFKAVMNGVVRVRR